jgi:hypothetical protein
MEMVQRPHQAVLDDYAAGKIGADALISRTGWKDRWGYDFALYQPIIDRAVQARAALLALNISKELRKRIRDVDLDGLTDAERARVPELDLEDPAHRAWWDTIMAEMADVHGHGASHAKDDDVAGDDDPHGDDPHGDDPHGDDPHGDDPRGDDPHGDDPHAGAGESAADGDGGEPATDGDAGEPAADGDAGETDDSSAMDKMYRAQVLWDETMADTASRWLAGGDDRMAIILAGNGHCHDSAIPHRIVRRGYRPVLSVRPVIDTGEGEVADLLAAGANDYLFVMTMPKSR